MINTGIIDYLRSSLGFASRKRAMASMAIFFLWLAVVIFTSSRHELWRDEVRALSIALQPESLWQLPMVLRNEGHPILWYLILRSGYLIAQTPLILKIASICTAFGAVSLFFRYSPFPVWHKILFMAGVLPLYEYSVVTRNYGISMLLFFLFATLYPRRNEHPFVLALVLAALANTNAHSCILAVLMTIFWFWNDIVIDRQFSNYSRVAVLAGALFVIGAGIFGAAVTSFPDPGTSVTKVHSLTASQVLETLWMNIVHPGANYRDLFEKLSLFFRDLLLWLLIAGLLIRKHAAVLLAMGVFMMGTFFSVIYEGHLPQEGIVLVFIISLYWIIYEQRLNQAGSDHNQFLHYLHNFSFYIILPIIFTMHIFMSIDFTRMDLLQQISSSKAFAELLNTNSQYRQAIIIGEPDFTLESLPYYAPNRIFLPREGKWRKYVKFTGENKASLSLGDLLNAVRLINSIEKKPVLIALGHLDLPPLPRGEISYSYDKMFTWSLQELADLRANTLKVAEFRSAVSDENYEIYLVR